MVNNYNNGKIYKIESNIGDMVYYGSTTKKLLSQRMTFHRGNYKSWLKNKTGFITAFKLFEEYGIENCIITLVEPCPCENKDELKARERFFIKNLECVNKNIPGRTDKEYREDNKDKIKQYREDNQDKIKEYKKEYQKDNRDKIKEYQKEYKKDNQYKIKEYQKEYREDNKDKIKQYREDNQDKIKEYQKEYQKDNRDKIKEYKKDNRDKIKEYQTGYQKEYQKDNRDKIKVYKKEYDKIKFTCRCGSICRISNKTQHERTKKHQQFITTQ